MRVAIYTLTRDRLFYTRYCLKVLRERAMYPYDLYIIDNASTDGTVEWLTKNRGMFKGVWFNAKNYGNHIGNNQAVSFIGPDNYDLIVRMDNDCEVITEGLLAQVVDLYKILKKTNTVEDFLLSPRVEGIVNQPHRGSTMKVGNWTLGKVYQVGGLFRIMPSELLREFHWDPKASVVTGEEVISPWHRERGGVVAYIEELVVNHYETTVGQVERYPDYQQRKVQEWSLVPDQDYVLPSPVEG